MFKRSVSFQQVEDHSTEWQSQEGCHWHSQSGHLPQPGGVGEGQRLPGNVTGKLSLKEKEEVEAAAAGVEEGGGT